MKIQPISCERVGLVQQDSNKHMMPKSFFFLLCITLSASSFDCSAHPKDFKPYFASLKPNEVNVRVGPGQNYPIDWVYLKPGIPLEVIATFDVWRKIRDVEGTEGWVHQTMLTLKRHALIHFPELLLYAKPEATSPPLARLERGVLVKLKKCSGEWCQVQIGDFKGWLKREGLWGLYPGEEVK